MLFLFLVQWPEIKYLTGVNLATPIAETALLLSAVLFSYSLPSLFLIFQQHIVPPALRHRDSPLSLFSILPLNTKRGCRMASGISFFPFNSM